MVNKYCMQVSESADGCLSFTMVICSIINLSRNRQRKKDGNTYILFKYSSICSGSVISPLRSEQLLFYAPFEKTGENENTTMGEGDGTKQNKTKTKTKFTQKNKPISAKVTSWPSSSAEHRLQSSENLPYQCFVSCPGVPLL